MNRTPLDRLLAFGSFAVEIGDIILIGAVVVAAFAWFVS